MNNDRLELAKCPPSPTGVHHWLIPTLGAHPIGHCKFCSEERQFENTASRWDYGEKRKIAVRQDTVNTSTFDRYYVW